MFYLRQSTNDDLDHLSKLAKMVHFINLPADKEIIASKIARSASSFLCAATGEKLRVDASRDGSAAKNSPIYMFSIIDSETNTCHGTSMIIARMGTPEAPNLSFQVSTRHFFSKDLGQGTSHTMLQLFLDTSGPTEIGGLILTPSMRKHPDRLGKQLSLVRFHVMGLYPHLFSDHIVAEMMAPITADGRSLFWDALGRKFINMSYTEADMFCQHSREFMLSLLPREEIYATLLPGEARKQIAQVGPDTIPARVMLEELGFKYTHRIDPFDGGPHLEANVEDIPFIKRSVPDIFAGYCTPSQAKRKGFVSVLHEDGQFRSAYTGYAETESGGRAIKLPRETADLLMLEAGMPVGVTGFDIHAKNVNAETAARAARPAAKPARKKKRARASA
jgi:arginine N-succinyltransferase